MSSKRTPRAKAKAPILKTTVEKVTTSEDDEIPPKKLSSAKLNSPKDTGSTSKRKIFRHRQEKQRFDKNLESSNDEDEEFKTPAKRKRLSKRMVQTDVKTKRAPLLQLKPLTNRKSKLKDLDPWERAIRKNPGLEDYIKEANRSLEKAEELDLSIVVETVPDRLNRTL